MSRQSKFSDATKDAIRALADEGLNAIMIGKRLGEPASNVQWFMYSDGLRAPAPIAEPMSYMRNGRRVHRYTLAEDRFIEARRVAGDTSAQIAAAAAEKFGTERTPHSIDVRLIMLAAGGEE